MQVVLTVMISSNLGVQKCKYRHVGRFGWITDGLLLVGRGDVVRSLVNEVHEQGGDVRGEYDAAHVPTEMESVDQANMRIRSLSLLN